MSALVRHNVRISGTDGPPLVFAHGYGCDQQVWRHVAPAFEHDHRIVLFDHVGAGGSDASAFDRRRYASLEAYARDVIDICREARLEDVVLVGHSISAMIGVVAARLAPELFSRLVLVAPNPCYLRDGDYDGGFSREDIEGLLETLDSNFFSWARMMAPVIMNSPEQPELAEELTNRFCAMDLRIARHFARITFLSDCRHELPQVRQECLVLQCQDDALAPLHVGQYLRAQLPRAQLAVMNATGHCPHLSAPEETVALMRRFLEPSREEGAAACRA